MKGSAPGIPVQNEGPLKAALLCVWKLGATFFLWQISKEKEGEWIRETEEVFMSFDSETGDLLHLYIEAWKQLQELYITFWKEPDFKPTDFVNVLNGNYMQYNYKGALMAELLVQNQVC